MNNYTLLTNKIFYGSEKEKSLFSEVKDYNLLPIMEFLYDNTNRRGITIFTLEQLVYACGYTKVDTHKGRNLDSIKNIMNMLYSKGIIDVDINNLKPSQYTTCNFNSFDKNEDDNNIKFSVLTDEDKKLIINYNETKIDNTKLLFYFCYLNSRIYKRSKSEYETEKAGTCFIGFDKIEDDINIKSNTIAQYNDILVKLGLIKIVNCGLAYNKNDKNKFPKETPNHYALVKTDVNKPADEELKESIRIYKDTHSELVFTNSRKYKNNDKKANGYISRINQLEKEGKATEKQIAKRDSLLDSKNIEVVTIKELRDKIIKLSNIDKEDYASFVEENIGKEYYSVEDLQDLINRIKKGKVEIEEQVSSTPKSMGKKKDFESQFIQDEKDRTYNLERFYI